MKLIYVAGPYRGPNAWEIECNIRRAETLALEAWRLGVAVICPHANTAHFQGAAPDEVWLEGDLEMLRRCDAVLLTPDWGRSAGARAERDEAVRRGIPVLLGLDELREFLNPKPPVCSKCGFGKGVAVHDPEAIDRADTDAYHPYEPAA